MKMNPLITPGSSVTDVGTGAWNLEIPPGTKGSYRLAQIDDYSTKTRRSFPWQPPVTLSLKARVSAPDISGTWGFGFWNDPFSLSLGFGGGSRRFPALPNAAWFFYASHQNYLSFHGDLPANGFLAATFRSPAWPPPILALGVPALPFLIWKPTVRLLRRLARRVVHQDAAQIDIDLTQWHQYSLNWQNNSVRFAVNGKVIFDTSVSPKASLGFVLWIDNQYAALSPVGGLGYGTLLTEEVSWLKVEDLQIDRP